MFSAWRLHTKLRKSSGCSGWAKSRKQKTCHLESIRYIVPLTVFVGAFRSQSFIHSAPIQSRRSRQTHEEVEENGDV